MPKLNYPGYEINFSKQIDKQFNFTNVVDFDNGMKLDGNIMLEPRLQEYLKKKKFYKKNNIKPDISIEQEFQITNIDRRILRAFLKGEKHMYDQQNPKSSSFDKFKEDNNNLGKYFPSKSYRDNDPRVKKIKPEKFKKPQNMGMFAPDNNKSDLDKYYEFKNKNCDYFDSRDFSNLDPKIDQFAQEGYSPFENGNNISTYCSFPSSQFSEKSDMDYENKLVIPKIASNLKRDMSTYGYRVSDYTRKFMPDVASENKLLRGLQSEGPRESGYGHPSVPVEHYFQYLHVDEYENLNYSADFKAGTPTRSDNKKVARENYSREII